MTIGWLNKSTRPDGRTAFADNKPVDSKATHRYGENPTSGNILGSTGENPATLDHRDAPPSIPARSHTERAAHVVQNAGWDPATGRWIPPRHPNSGRHDGGHEGARRASTDHASGMANSASGGQHGEPTKRPTQSKNTGTHTADAGALAGDPHSRPSYHGGKGPVR